MELIFLGTSSGTPTKQSNVSGTAIRLSNSKNWCLVDCGEGTQHRILKTNLSLNKLSAIFITHVHGDHCYGLPGLLASAAMSGRTDDLLIVAPEGIKEFIQATQKYTDVKQPYPLRFVSVEELHDVLTLDEFDIQVAELSHRVRSFAYAFTEKKKSIGLNADKLLEDNIPRGPLWGRIHQGENIVLDNGHKVIAEHYWKNPEPPRTIIISGDNDKPELLADLAKTADVLVHESTYTEEVALKVGPGPQHSYAKQVAAFAESVALKNVVLTHFSARYQKNGKKGYSITDIEEEARAEYKGNLFLARDLDCLCLGRDLILRKLEPDH